MNYINRFARSRTFTILHTAPCAAFVVAACILASCGKQDVPLGFIGAGGKSRSNNYEANGTFSASLTFQETTRLSQNDKTTRLPGASSALVPVSFAVSYIPTVEGSVVRVGNKLVEWHAELDALDSNSSNGSNNPKAIITAAAVTDREDTFYGIASDGALYAIASNGKRKWKTHLFKPHEIITTTDLLLVGDGVVLGCENRSPVSGGELVKVGLDGRILWRRALTQAPVRSVAADEQDNLLVALTHNTFGATDSLALFAPDGKQTWAVGFERTRLLRMPVINGTTAFVTGVRQASADVASERVPVLIAVGLRNGSIAWQNTILTTAQGVAACSDMVVVAGAQTSVAEPYSAVQAFSLQGKELWRKGFALSIASPPMISKDNIAFIGSKSTPQGNAVGIYYLKRDGTFGSVFSISEMPPMTLQPVVDYDCNMVFAMTEVLGLVRVGRSPVQKLLPY